MELIEALLDTGCSQSSGLSAPVPHQLGDLVTRLTSVTNNIMSLCPPVMMRDAVLMQ